MSFLSSGKNGGLTHRFPASVTISPRSLQSTFFGEARHNFTNSVLQNTLYLSLLGVHNTYDLFNISPASLLMS